MQRAVGRVEGKLDLILQRQDTDTKRLERAHAAQEVRISSNTSKIHWLAGAFAVLMAFKEVIIKKLGL